MISLCKVLSVTKYRVDVFGSNLFERFGRELEC